MRKNPERDKQIYNLFISGKRYRWLATEFEITEHGVALALIRHRKANNLPIGRNAK